MQLTPSTTLRAYLRWWVDTDLVEQVEDGLITATTRSSYSATSVGSTGPPRVTAVVSTAPPAKSSTLRTPIPRIRAV